MVAFGATLTSCKKECVTSYEAVYYEPVYTTWDEIKASIGSEAPRSIQNPGKMFAIGDLLFISEVGKGIHVIDNSDKSDPQNIRFINIPGTLDVAVAGNTLYTDNYTDLIALDISDLENVTEIDRVSNVFFGNAEGFWYDYSTDRVITGWEVTETVYEYDCDEIMLFDQAGFGGVFETANGPVAVAAAGSDVAGRAGSMARFALYQTNLFALNDAELHTFSIAGQLSLGNTMYVEWGVETLFPYGNHLFVGANNGMHILNVVNPMNPVLVSTYSHITSCDPVVVEDDLAYVTLRSGNNCQNFTDQLEVIDISDLSQPQLLKTYPMFNPHGLGLAGDLLFLCDGDEGLKVFDKQDPLDLSMIKQYDGINAFDVIPYGNYLLMIGSDGFYQYDYSDIDNIHLVSFIAVEG